MEAYCRRCDEVLDRHDRHCPYCGKPATTDEYRY